MTNTDDFVSGKDIENNKETTTLTRRIRLVPVLMDKNSEVEPDGADEELKKKIADYKYSVYNHLKKTLKNQITVQNLIMTNLYLEELYKTPKEDREELRRLYSRMPGSKKESAYSEIPQEFLYVEHVTGVEYCDIYHKVYLDFCKACRDGLLYGKVSLPSYSFSSPINYSSKKCGLRRNNPRTNNGIYHMDSCDEEFFEHLVKEKNPKLFLSLPAGMNFKLSLGSLKKSNSLRKEFIKIFNGVYKICGSSIEIDKSNKVFLNLTIKIPREKYELNSDNVVGVDLGVANPAVCVMNNSEHSLFLGDKEDMFNLSKKYQEEKRRVQKGLAFTNGGHGRTKKLQKLERLKEHEKNFRGTMNHKLSKKIVDFAVDNKAKYINLEKIDSRGFREREDFVLLRNWGYYDLTQKIVYKTKQKGIQVRFVEPAYTSQTCSCCGQRAADNEASWRVNQSDFICRNSDCEKYLKVVNADYNAAKNIATCTKFCDDQDDEINKSI
ncbi:MAG: transposase [Lachnospiraceae bacterium]|nr:transposase [Lachnospiraceae bacterium]